MATKAAAVDFSKILSSGVGKETAAQLVAFRKRNDDAKRSLSVLKTLPATLDFAHYKNVLKVCVTMACMAPADEHGLLRQCVYCCSRDARARRH